MIRYIGVIWLFGPWLALMLVYRNKYLIDKKDLVALDYTNEEFFKSIQDMKFNRKLDAPPCGGNELVRQAEDLIKKYPESCENHRPPY